MLGTKIRPLQCSASVHVPIVQKRFLQYGGVRVRVVRVGRTVTKSVNAGVKLHEISMMSRNSIGNDDQKTA